jgi:hypothetical protein
MLLPQICEVWLKARDKEKLTKIQFPVADRADILMRGLAHTGIIALTPGSNTDSTRFRMGTDWQFQNLC